MKEHKLNKNKIEASTTESTDAALLAAVLEPHLSLSQSGFLTLMAEFIAISFAAGIALAYMGA